MDERRTAAIWAIETLEQAGFSAYLVGGCVRDHLLHKIPNDYDVTTDATPEQVQAIFPRTVPTGLQHGTVTVLYQHMPIEVTTFRVEDGYQDHRRPDQVRFVTSLREDLARRDFTINAMAEDAQGKVYDYFGGLPDLADGIIRTVGNPMDRFHEDALRMVRAARFSAQFEFTLDPTTEQAMGEMYTLCRHLSVERITAEIEKIWSARNPSIGIQHLFNTKLIQAIPPFYRWEAKDQKQKIPLLDQVDDRIIRWTLLLEMMGTEVKDCQTRLKELRLSTHDITQIETCFRLGTTLTQLDEKSGKLLILQVGSRSLWQAVQLAMLLRRMGRMEWETIHQWESEMPVQHLRDLAIVGTELIDSCAIPAGPWVKGTLAHLLEQVALGELTNTKDALLKEGCRFVTADSR